MANRPNKLSLLSSTVKSAISNSLSGATAQAPGARLAPPPSEPFVATVLPRSELSQASDRSKNPGTDGLEPARDQSDDVNEIASVDPRIAEVVVDPSHTRMNEFHRRSMSTMSGAAIEDLANQIRASGQSVPALGWKLPQSDADGVSYVLVYGARRRAATLKLGIGLKMLLLPHPLMATDVVRVMHAENHGRMDYLPIEDAREYQSYMASGAFTSMTALAEGLGVEITKLSRLLALLQIPPEILSLYTEPAWLTLINGAKLSAEAKNPAHRKKLMAAVDSWKTEGRAGDPTSFLFSSLQNKPTPTKATKLKDAKGREVGFIKSSPDGNMQVMLGPKCNVEIRIQISELLKQHFPAVPL